jgi:hypothetical protein
MAKAELKTKRTNQSVEGFLNEIQDEQKRADCFQIAELMEKATGERPAMWGPSIIGFGQTTLKYGSGRELDWMKIGFSPRKDSITIYCIAASEPKLLEGLGKYKTGKGCLYIKRLSDVDVKVLEKMIKIALTKKGSGC